MPALDDTKRTGSVKFFSNTKGFGFITPDDDSEDLFIHQTSIYAKGYRSLANGELVEYNVETEDDGRKKAVNVTGPGGDYVQGTPPRSRQPPRERGRENSSSRDREPDYLGRY